MLIILLSAITVLTRSRVNSHPGKSKARFPMKASHSYYFFQYISMIEKLSKFKEFYTSRGGALIGL